MRFIGRNPVQWLAAILAAGCCGCAWRQPSSPGLNAFLPAGSVHPKVQRVAVLPAKPLEELRVDPAAARMLEPVLFRELAAHHRFELVGVTRDDLASWTGRETWSAEEALPPDLLGRVQAATGADAILFAAITAFRSHAPLQVGWRLKLVASDSGAILWAVDQVFDASDPRWRSGAHFAQPPERFRPWNRPEIPWEWHHSPARFAEFTLRALFSTLPFFSAQVAAGTSDERFMGAAGN